MKKQLHIRKSFLQGWHDFKTQPLFFVALLMVTFALGWVLNAIGNIERGGVVLQILISLFSLIVQTFISLGLTTIFLRKSQGHTVHWHDALRLYKKVVMYFGVSIIYQFMVMIGLILLVIPGVYLGLRYQYAQYLIVAHEHMSIRDAFTQSSKITAGVKWKMLGLVAISIGVGILGLLAFGIGLAVVLPVIMLAHWHAFASLEQQTDSLSTVS